MFKDREDAGRKLAERLLVYRDKKSVVLALPRGGVAVGYEVAKALHAPLDTIVARKIGAPGNPEYAIGAIAPGGVRIMDDSVWGVESIVSEELREMERRQRKYKSGFYVGDLLPDAIIVVDDGVATGKTACAALASAAAAYPGAIRIFAAPVAAPDSLEEIKRYADEVVVLEAPPEFMAVGEWYAFFPQLTDEEVIEYLEKARR